MRILTVRQPWAQAIIHGGKRVENRPRNIAGGYRGPVAIHAGKQTDYDGWVDFGAYALTNSMHHGHPDALGAIIGVVDLVDVHSLETCELIHPEILCSDWAQGGETEWHLVLTNPRPLTNPIPYVGALGLRDLAVRDPETVLDINRQIGATA